ncbi:MAG TPA: CinA family protein [Mariprofundaceae bacterium]|nr:CinA family protein [Mariprofundaceae bacterium]
MGSDTVVHLVLSESGRESLAAGGISTGWLTAWIFSAGAGDVQFHMLENDSWKDAGGWQLFLAGEPELMRVALYHGLRIRASEDGGRDLAGADVLQLENPSRRAWHYPLSEGSERVILLPIGDIAYQRWKWLSILSGDQALDPLYVWSGDEGGMALEPGLRGALLLPEGVADADLVLNDGGYLPEEALNFRLRERQFGVRFAESCTGGGMSERFSRLPGASALLDRSWVTYSNRAKSEMLGVPREVIDAYGAVSRETVEAMAAGGGDGDHACIAVSGVAGPGGGSAEKPVGTVWIGVVLPDGRTVSESYCWPGSRAEIRRRSVNAGLALLIRSLQA